MFDATKIPAFTVVNPSYVFAPESVSVPMPCLMIAPVSEPSEITPANVVLVESPDVSIPDPSVIAAAVSPVVDVAIDATVSLKPARLNVALLLTTTADELLMRSLATPRASTPVDTVVAPVYVLSPDNVNVPVPCFVRPIDAPETTPDIDPDMVDATFTDDVAPSDTLPDNSPFWEK